MKKKIYNWGILFTGKDNFCWKPRRSFYDREECELTIYWLCFTLYVNYKNWELNRYNYLRELFLEEGSNFEQYEEYKSLRETFEL
jgi:hypothetical protein